MSDYAQLPSELQREVQALVEQTKDRSDWLVKQTLRSLEIAPATYYRWRRTTTDGRPRSRSPASSMVELLSSERQAIIDYALKHPEVRHRELAWKMLDDGVAAAAAIGTLDGEVRPDIQSDHGSCFIAREFAQTLAESDVGHTKIRPHTPTDNAQIERYHRTIGERIDEQALENYTQAKAVISAIIDAYNNVRLHSALSFLRPVDYYRGNPEALPAQRRRKLQTARELRKQENIKLRQRLLPLVEDRTVA